MPTYTLVPAYGRDYTSKPKVVDAFEANHDFIDHGFQSSGKPINKQDIASIGGGQVTLRYSKLRKAIIVNVEAS
jgi:hypothetical protein